MRARAFFLWGRRGGAVREEQVLLLDEGGREEECRVRSMSRPQVEGSSGREEREEDDEAWEDGEGGEEETRAEPFCSCEEGEGRRGG
jgi:hypothetical protein